jgi:hypothetical protein
VISGFSPYRRYVEKSLKSGGLKKTLSYLEKIFSDAIAKVYEVLPHDVSCTSSAKKTLDWDLDEEQRRHREGILVYRQYFTSTLV